MVRTAEWRSSQARKGFRRAKHYLLLARETKRVGAPIATEHFARLARVCNREAVAQARHAAVLRRHLLPEYR